MVRGAKLVRSPLGANPLIKLNLNCYLLGARQEAKMN